MNTKKKLIFLTIITLLKSQKMTWKNLILLDGCLLFWCFLTNSETIDDNSQLLNQTNLEKYTDLNQYEVIEEDLYKNSSDTHSKWMFLTPSSELNQTFENFTLYAEMMRAQTESLIHFDPNYIYETTNNEIMPNISRRSYPVEIESNPNSILNSYIVEFCENATESDHQELLTYIKINDLNETLHNWFSWVIDDLWMPVNETHGRWILITNETTSEAIEDLATLSPICYLVTDAKVEASNILSWGLDRIDQKKRPLDNYYDGAWINKNYYDGRGVKVFVFDSGLYHSHQEFENKPAGWAYNTYDHFNCPSGNCFQKNSILYGNNDGSGHGTHVAGTVGGRNVGVAPGCMIHGVKVLDNSGNGRMNYIIRAISRQMTEFLISIKFGIPVIVSMSFSGSRHSSIDRAIRNLYNNGILSVVAAGNDGESASLHSPAGEPKAISVMASYSRFINSNYIDDKTDWSNTDGDIYAPGASIYSSYISSSSSYVLKSGTSMAAPHVSGILACHYQHNKKMSNVEAITKLYTYSQLIAIKLPSIGNIISGGWLALLPREKPIELCHRGTQNGDINYCHSNCKCSHGEGNCDNDEQCVSGTYCGNDYGSYFGMVNWVGVCVSDSYVPPQPSSFPTSNPSIKPNPVPTAKPTLRPIPVPTLRPIPVPTLRPIPVPTLKPIPDPTFKPTSRPTLRPIPVPTKRPTMRPQSVPTFKPFPNPTKKPNWEPTGSPIQVPTMKPLPVPTSTPIVKPTMTPIPVPTSKPTIKPNPVPTIKPSMNPIPFPTTLPTFKPFPNPTFNPTFYPIIDPTMLPISSPTNYQSPEPSMKQTIRPSENFVYNLDTNNTQIQMLGTDGPTQRPTKAPIYTKTESPTLINASKSNVNNSNILWTVMVSLGSITLLLL